MMYLLFVGDGERDAVTVPRLVERIVEVPVREEARPWARLHGAGKGYGRKLAFAMRQAKDLGTSGLVAVVDADRDPKRGRLRALREARDAERQVAPPFPTAIGEAVPHGEAWLLDDAVAVRQALQLADDMDVPTVRKTKDPKGVLDGLWKQSRRARESALLLLADVARLVDPSRCRHVAETGYQAFAEDVRNELRGVR
jgi:hypothetical protein